jgi:hypothetical protein
MIDGGGHPAAAVAHLGAVLVWLVIGLVIYFAYGALHAQP